MRARYASFAVPALRRDNALCEQSPSRARFGRGGGGELGVPSASGGKERELNFAMFPAAFAALCAGGPARSQRFAHGLGPVPLVTGPARESAANARGARAKALRTRARDRGEATGPVRESAANAVGTVSRGEQLDKRTCEGAANETATSTLGFTNLVQYVFHSAPIPPTAAPAISPDVPLIQPPLFFRRVQKRIERSLNGVLTDVL
jgi:hypothetical protein